MSATKPSTPNTSILKRGSKGATVKELQRLLNLAGAAPPLSIDGDFGGKTDAAVRAIQSRLGLVVDGLVGQQTTTALKRATTPVTSGRPEPDKSAMAGAVPAAAVVPSGANPPPNAASLILLDTTRAIDTIWIHCAATPEGKDYTVADIRAWHKARGWSDIGYHYVIYRDGSIHLGRPIGQIGAHVEGHNLNSVGIVYVGGLAADGKTAKDTRTAAQRSSLLWLTDALRAKHRGIKRVRGHNEVAAKACPSFDVRRDPLGLAA
ncbi:N-acetylmuramoyl-L-alanine amidase [Shinella pollutisoli]|uniref:N-acetylmuramoyl-L-alanine amidase n=1 Tax=Shinella pollutisoli TaxID=2250594 RepID=A0ABV7DJX2_9HYPH|nr:N-acetylmuramoyl-L-alanine amidase [Shinella pollutisoli]